MATYTKSFSVDFGGSWEQTQFSDEIKAEIGITQNLSGVTKNGDVVKIMFDGALNAGEQTTLDNLIAAHVPVAPVGGISFNYDALVAADGTGDYLKPSAAFAAGAVTVYVKSGTYIELSDINIPNNGVMVGESIAPVVIYFVGPVSVKIDGSGGTKETAGTISVTKDTKNVNGSGTAFLNLNAGDYILLEQNFYQIAAINSDTSVTLVETYRGNSLSGVTYIAQTMHSACQVSNMIITNSSTQGLYMRAARSTTLSSVGLLSNDVGMKVIDCSTNSLTGVNCFDSTQDGMCFVNSYSIGLVNGESYNNGAHGYCVSGNSDNIVFNGVLANNNGGNGINISGTSTNILINDCTVKRNAGTGITTTSTTGSAIIDGSLMAYNGGDGVEFNGANNILSNCVIAHNGARGVHAGSNGTITGNQIFNNATIGIDMTTNDYSQVSSNNIYNNTTDGIYISGNQNGISDNSVRDNGGKGIHIDGGDDNDVDGNTVAGNTSDGIKLTGACTQTIISNNRVKSNIIGIDIPATSDDCVITSNIVTDNSSHGIQIASDDCIVSSNRCVGNTGDGCVIATGATTNTVKINRFTGNTGSDLTDNGTGTIV